MNEFVAKIVEAYTQKNNGLLEASIRNMMDANIDNPFELGTPEHNLFARAKVAHRKWRNKEISGRRGRVQMLEYVTEIARILSEKKDEKPVKELVEESVEESIEESIKEPAEEPVVFFEPAVTTYETVTLDVPKHILGVIPAKKTKKKAKKDDSERAD